MLGRGGGVTIFDRVNNDKQKWHCLRFIVPRQWADDISAHCFELGSCGAQLEQEGEATRLIAYFDAALASQRIRREIEQFLSMLGLVEIQIATEHLEEQDWEAEWRSYFSPIQATPRIVIHPSWFPLEVREDQIALVIDPKMAFGTGGHESTQLCLQGLENTLCPGDRCLDLGTGSGVLSIAAAHLGAGRILAVDIDPRALENARENLANNGIDETKVQIEQGSIDQISGVCFELILANIQSHVLRPLLGSVHDLLPEEGHAIFSGLLAREERMFCAWVEEAGLGVETVLAKNNWICLVAQRRA